MKWSDFNDRSDPLLASAFEEKGPRVRELPDRILNGWELNVYAIQHSRFREVLLLDAYHVPVADPCFFFDLPKVRRLGFLPENAEIFQIRRNAGLHFTNLSLGST